jgi:hypothetical protein
MIRLGKVSVTVKIFCQLFMPTKLPAIVKSQGYIENAMAKMIIEVGYLIALTLMSAPVLLMLALALATGS